jgi:DNA-binding NarL/FixJ family response regulator
MIGLSGTIGIKQLKHNYPTTPLILFTSIPSDEAESSCKEAGTDLYIEKTCSPKIISELIQKQLGWTQKFKITATQGLMDDGLIRLSKRQKQLLVLVDAGLSNVDIAKKLDISAHTVKVHLWRFYKKLGISSRTQLSKFARDNGYL